MNYLIIKPIGNDEIEVYDISGKDLKDAIKIALKINHNYFGWGIDECLDINIINIPISNSDFNKYVDFIYECIVWNAEILVFESEYPITNAKINKSS